LPYGGGGGWGGANNPTGGSGLSDKTYQTTANPVSANVGGSVAELMDTTIGNATTEQTLYNGMETVRSETLAFSITTDGSIGILPGYVEAFGPAGARIFGLKNT